jgi:hypothetical protein
MRHLAVASAAVLFAITAAQAQTSSPTTSPTPDMPGASNVPGEKMKYPTRDPSRTGPADPTRPPLAERPGAYDIPSEAGQAPGVISAQRRDRSSTLGNHIVTSAFTHVCGGGWQC